METALYLLPVTLGDTPVETVLPSYNKEVILGIRHFIVEDVRSARRFLKKVDREIDIDSLTFYTLNKHTSPEDISGYLKPLEAGNPMGVISEAGCPAVADPGADVVAIAQRKNLRVVPLVGPSSIILSVMGSGFNGQSFAFHGYLPIEPGERAKKLKALEQRVYNEHQTQLFIETPYRKIKRRVMSVLDLVGLRKRANSYPTELSGGEQQRVAIARAIVNDPLLVIADEPTGNLDPETSWDIMRIFSEINESGTTIVMATHDKEIVDNMEKRVIAIEKGSIVRDDLKGVYGYES